MRKHLLIAGTGRSGTSFLVKYLTELGLDTHLSRNGDHAYWDEGAHAGLEDMPLAGDSSTLPYVVKSPYAYQFIDALLARDDVQLDGVIIPVRDLIEAASSRTLTELQHLNRVVPWLVDIDQTWEQWALTPGGVVYSLNALDQARLLAVGFHHLVQRLIKAGIRISFIHFPEMAEDPDYLFRQLQGFLPAEVTLEQARTAHANTANRDEVRVGAELKEARAPGDKPTVLPPMIQYPGLAEHDAIAQRRENRRLQDEIARIGNLDHRTVTPHQFAQQLAYQTARADLTRDALTTAQVDLAAAQGRIAELTAELARATHNVSLIQSSMSWRFTTPLRSVSRALKLLLRGNRSG